MQMQNLGYPLLTLAFMGFSWTAQAAEEAYSKNYKSCMDASGGVTVEMLNCTAAETEYQDKRLNQAYKIALEGMQQSQQKGLREAQRLWLSFRDADCQVVGNQADGSTSGLVYNDCILQKTQLRAGELEALKNE